MKDLLKNLWIHFNVFIYLSLSVLFLNNKLNNSKKCQEEIQNTLKNQENSANPT